MKRCWTEKILTWEAWKIGCSLANSWLPRPSGPAAPLMTAPALSSAPWRSQDGLEFRRPRENLRKTATLVWVAHTQQIRSGAPVKQRFGVKATPSSTSVEGPGISQPWRVAPIAEFQPWTWTACFSKACSGPHSASGAGCAIWVGSSKTCPTNMWNELEDLGNERISEIAQENFGDCPWTS